MIIIISGGIGSGKSQVSARLRELGYEVLSADEVNKEMLAEPAYLCKLKSVFPQCFDGETLDRGRLKKLVFADEGERLKLNALAHPEITKRLLKMAEGKGGIVFIEIPLVIESGLTGYDYLWVVEADKQTRIARIIERDKVDASLAKKIIDSQAQEKQSAARADLIIHNNGSRQELYAIVDCAVRNLCNAKRQNDTSL